MAKQPEWRTNEVLAEDVIRKLIPTQELLHTIADAILRCIEQAHLVAPRCWELTLDQKFLRLNIGQVAVANVRQEIATFVVTPFSEELSAHYDYEYNRGRPIYPAVPVESAICRLDLSARCDCCCSTRQNL